MPHLSNKPIPVEPDDPDPLAFWVGLRNGIPLAIAFWLILAIIIIAIIK